MTVLEPPATEHGRAALDAADSAEAVLLFFEESCPGDERPRLAIEAARAWARGDLDEDSARAAAFAAHAAARGATTPDAVAAARAAGHAAAAVYVPAQAGQARRYADRARTSRAMRGAPDPV
jgi:hypothetical protein